MKQIKKSILGLIACLSMSSVVAQNQAKIWQSKQNFISIGMAKPFLVSGQELMEAQQIRQAGLSYFEGSEGHRKAVGNYSAPIGWGIGLGFYNPVKKVDQLMWGSELHLSLTGSEPEAGYGEAYYFNYMVFNFGVKYHPLQHQNIYLKVNGGFAGVMTKNRFVDVQQSQAFLHQFGLGINGQLGLGYAFKIESPFISLLGIAVDYKLSNVRVEVNGIGNDKWTYGALDFKLAVGFY